LARTDPGPDRTQGTSSGSLLELIRSRDAWTRQQLLDATGMSRPTLLARLGPLLGAGLVYEAGSTASTGGRPANLIRFDDRRLHVLTVDIGHTHGTVSVTDIHGRELRSARRPVDIARDPPEAVLGPLLALADRLLAVQPEGRLAGVGLGLPAPISPETGLPGQIWVMPGWDGYPVRDRVRDRWDVPLILENDARAFALGEAAAQPSGTVLGVKWANGIGAGLVVGAECLAGEHGAAGDIGHIRVGGGGRRCRCGRTGCLAAYASGHALLRRLGRRRIASLDDLARRAEDGDTRVTDALGEAADLVGTVLAALIAMLNPGVLVLGGSIGRIPQAVARVDRRLRAVALSRSTERLQVVPSRLGERAATVGLARLVARRVLHAGAVDDLLSAPGR
jgi:predicted NBD/HSP70 family sugar kinase